MQLLAHVRIVLCTLHRLLLCIFSLSMHVRRLVTLTCCHIQIPITRPSSIANNSCSPSPPLSLLGDYDFSRLVLAVLVVLARNPVDARSFT